MKDLSSQGSPEPNLLLQNSPLLKRSVKRRVGLFSSVLMLLAISGGMSAIAYADSDEEEQKVSSSSTSTTLYKVSWRDRKNKLSISGSSDRNADILVVNAFNLEQVFGTPSPDRRGRWRVSERNPSPVPCRVAVLEAGSGSVLAEKKVRNAPADCAPKAGGGGGEPPPPPPPEIPNVSINSTSANGPVGQVTLVPEQPIASDPRYQVLAVNDLGMHCGDLDTRISSILPPFNVLHAQVVERGDGGAPRILGKGEVSIEYSSASNPDDPALTIAPVLAKDGSVYKTNFWDIALQAYAPFYPSGVLGLFYDANPEFNVDTGLPVPNVETFYLGNGELHAIQQAMPGISSPYVLNEAQPFKEHIGTLPFFINFPFGYTAELNLFEAAGVPIAVYDDFGRENPYPLMRVQAKVAGHTVSSVDTVMPISGEAECQRCHAAPADNGNGVATKRLVANSIELALSIDDPAENVPHDASVEWASDLNILALHDLKHKTELNQGYDPVSGKANKPVVCQTCHYTPALDLAQFGPLGPENDNVDPIVLNDGAIVIDSLANGRDQIKHKTMSNVMHSHHGKVDANGNSPGEAGYNADNLLFPAMPPAIAADGSKRTADITREILGETCYSCHPGTKTDCMRGAMANGGQVCQDCHGDMEQVGDDFSRGVTPATAGQFELGADYYGNPETPRVPWANEPGCGSCHTGGATDNLASGNDVMVNPTDSAGNTDGIRLAQAFRTNDDQATPIVPTNKMFAESVVAADDNAAAAGNPKLYRVSTGHGGLFCQSCHGSTHAEWPNGNFFANDNVASLQIQGHTGTITECSTCHEPSDFDKDGVFGLTLDGPHGMHPVGNADWTHGHENVVEQDGSASCQTCHGANGEGTVLSAMATDRVLECDEQGAVCTDKGFQEFPKDHQVSCSDCHKNEI